MGVQSTKAEDLECQRQQLIDELVAEHGPDWLEQYKPGTFGCHELLDRASLVTEMVEHFVLSHPACAQNPEWFALAERAATALQELYQKVGGEHLEAETSGAVPKR